MGIKTSFIGFLTIGLGILGGAANAVTVSQVTNETSYDAEPAVNPAGTQIAFTSDRDGVRSIYVVDLAGGAATQITSETTYEAGPSWSFDGSTMAFSSDRAGGLDIWIADSASLESNLVQITSETGSEYDPSFSPIDNALLYVSDQMGLPAVFLIPDGTDVATQITSETFYSADPAFSPDANTIVFAAKKETSYDLYTIAVGGALGSEVQLTSETAYDELDPQYSADGSTIYFTLRQWLNETDYADAVYSVPSTGGAITPFLNSTPNKGNPSPSPANINVLAFESDNAGNFDIWTVIDPAVVTQSPIIYKRWHRPNSAPIPYSTATVSLNIANAYDLGAFELKANYNKNVVVVRQSSHVTMGPFLGSSGNTAVPIGPTINNASGQTSYAAFSFGGNPGPNGGGLIAKIIYSTTKVAQVSTTNVTLTDVKVTNMEGNLQPVSATQTVAITVCHYADRDCDNDVDVVDIQLVAGLWNNPGAYNPDRDVDGDGDIDIVDIQLVAGQWNTFAPFTASASSPGMFRYGMLTPGSTSPEKTDWFIDRLQTPDAAYLQGCVIVSAEIPKRVEG